MYRMILRYILKEENKNIYICLYIIHKESEEIQIEKIHNMLTLNFYSSIFPLTFHSLSRPLLNIWIAQNNAFSVLLLKFLWTEVAEFHV